MNSSARAAIAALLFIGAQAAPGLHAAFEKGHDVHVCCTDGRTDAHVDACSADHDAPPCPVCATVRAPASATFESSSLAFERAPVPAFTVPESIPVDPHHVEVP